MRIMKQKRGQFIIIAVLMISMLMISIGAVMYSAVTYYRHERWEEYSTPIDNVELNSRRLVEISLANYTQTLNNMILKDNLDQWRINLMKAYPVSGVTLTYVLAEDSQYAYGANIDYSLGLAYKWFEQASFSAANVTFAINITSIALTGYKFVAPTFLRVNITQAVLDSGTLAINCILDEGLTPNIDLHKDNFHVEILVTGQWQSINPTDFTLTSHYDYTTGLFIYEIRSTDVPDASAVSVEVTDLRNIRVIANSTVTT